MPRSSDICCSTCTTRQPVLWDRADHEGGTRDNASYVASMFLKYQLLSMVSQQMHVHFSCNEMQDTGASSRADKSTVGLACGPRMHILGHDSKCLLPSTICCSSSGYFCPVYTLFCRLVSRQWIKTHNPSKGRQGNLGKALICLTLIQ